MRSHLVVIVPLIAALGCASSEHYVYSPETANASQGGLPASRMLIPPERPQGSVQVTSSGITQVSPDGRQAIDVIHVRMAVSNDGDSTAWRVDSRDQLLEIAGQGRAAALFANSDLRTVPIVTVPPQQRHVLDLFFPLPKGIDARHLPQFDLIWQVDTSSRVVASRTAFERETDVAGDAGYGYGYGYGYPYDYAWYGGWGPYWWYGWGNHSWRSSHVAVGRFSGRYRGGMHGGISHGGFHGGGGHGGHR